MRSSFTPGLDALALSRGGAALAASLVWLAGGCGPGAATPMPEPPSLVDLSHVGPPQMEVVTAQTGPQPRMIEGSAGAVPANAVVRVTNLDGTDAAYATTARDDGSFDLALLVAFGNELRFEWLRGQEHSTHPVDAFFAHVPGDNVKFQLEPSPRFDCLHLTPAYVLDFGAVATTPLPVAVQNTCASDVSLDAPVLRRGAQGFQTTAAAQTIAPSSSAMLSVAYARTSATAAEDTLLFNVTNAGATIRYPVTLSAAAQP